MTDNERSTPDITPDDITPDDITRDDITAEISAALARYQATWDEQDYARLAEHWDTGDASPFYLPEEWMPGFIADWDSLRRYWDPTPGRVVIEAIRNVYSNVQAKLVAPDVAVATFDLRYDLKVVGQAPTGGDDRVLAVFVRKDGDWKFSAYAEAPLNPVALIRRLYQRSVPGDFDDYLAEHGRTPEPGAGGAPWGSA